MMIDPYSTPRAVRPDRPGQNRLKVIAGGGPGRGVQWLVPLVAVINAVLLPPFFLRGNPSKLGKAMAGLVVFAAVANLIGFTLGRRRVLKHIARKVPGSAPLWAGHARVVSAAGRTPVYLYLTEERIAALPVKGMRQRPDQWLLVGLDEIRKVDVTADWVTLTLEEGREMLLVVERPQEWAAAILSQWEKPATESGLRSFLKIPSA